MKTIFKLLLSIAILLMLLPYSAKAIDKNIPDSQCISYHINNSSGNYLWSNYETSNHLLTVNCTLKVEIELSNGITIEGTITIYDVTMVHCIALKVLYNL